MTTGQPDHETQDEAATAQQPTTNPFHHPRYGRSNAYDPAWVAANQMGPHALWLLESLTEVFPIAPGTKVLDLGCGRAMTSIMPTATGMWVDELPRTCELLEADRGRELAFTRLTATRR